jgi:hypothetical protein
MGSQSHLAGVRCRFAVFRIPERLCGFDIRLVLPGAVDVDWDPFPWSGIRVSGPFRLRIPNAARVRPRIRDIQSPYSSLYGRRVWDYCANEQRFRLERRNQRYRDRVAYAFSILTGLLTVTLFAQLAAVYLHLETAATDLLEVFRLRALGAGVLVILLSIATIALAASQAPALWLCFERHIVARVALAVNVGSSDSRRVMEALVPTHPDRGHIANHLSAVVSGVCTVSELGRSQSDADFIERRD